MEKFLETHNLSVTSEETEKCYLIDVRTDYDKKFELFEVYCWYDVLRVMKYYLSDNTDEWYRVIVEDCWKR